MQEHVDDLAETGSGNGYFDDLVYNCSNSSVLAMELLQSCIKP